MTTKTQTLQRQIDNLTTDNCALRKRIDYYVTANENLHRRIESLQKDLAGTLETLKKVQLENVLLEERLSETQRDLTDARNEAKLHREAEQRYRWAKDSIMLDEIKAKNITETNKRLCEIEQRLDKLEKSAAIQKDVDMKLDPVFTTAYSILIARKPPTVSDVAFVRNALRKYPDYFRNSKEFLNWVTQYKVGIFLAIDRLDEIRREQQ